MLGPKAKLNFTARLYDLFLSMVPNCSITNFKITSVKTLRVQKRALSIIAPDIPYQLCLDSFELESLSVRREKLCCKLFNEICDEQSNLHSLLPPRHHSPYNLRRQRTFSLPGFKTERFRKTFIPAMCSRHNPALPI